LLECARLPDMKNVKTEVKVDNRNFLPYFGPKGTKYVWNNGGLTYLPRITTVSVFPSPNSYMCSLDAYVQLRSYAYSDGTFQTTATFFDWRNSFVMKKSRRYKNELTALLKAEEIADSWVATFPKWVIRAAKEGWRSPTFERRKGLGKNVLDLDKGVISK